MSTYVIVDLEMCNIQKAVKKNNLYLKNELIEIGAALLNDKFEIIDTFMTYVHPQYGSIDKYIQRLTGITVSKLKNAPTVKKALEDFVAWLPDGAILVSWSQSDKKQIRKEIEVKDIVIPHLEGYLDTWEDCQKTFGEKMGTKKNYKLSEALIIADIIFSDGEHDALIDAKNTALLFAKMKKEPKLRLSKYYVDGNDEMCAMYKPFAKLLKNFSTVVS